MKRRPEKNSTQRVLVIGLDAAEITLIQQWSREGFLPHLTNLLEEGTSGHLYSTAEMLSGSVWPSISTGTLPGKHGSYYRLQARAGRQGVRGSNVQPCHQPPFWKLLDAAGQRCVIMDVPKSYPLSGLCGVQIFDWGTYDKYWTTQAIPASSLDNIINRWGRHPLEKEIKVPCRPRDYETLLQKLLTGVSLKGSAVRHLLSAESWDFSFVVFSETHVGGHYFWDVKDQRNSRGLDKQRDEASAGLLQTYRAVDRAIGQILGSLNGGTTVMVISGHGMSRNPRGSHLLPEVLQRLGVLVKHGDDGEDHNGCKRDWLKKTRDWLPVNFRQCVSRRLPREFRHYLSSRWSSADIDWGRTQAFCLPTDLQGYIRINLKGREPKGIVEPGSRYEELCIHLGEVLSRLVDPSTSQPVVRKVFKSDEVFPGPYRHHLPDLIVSWHDCGEITAVYSPETGLVSRKSSDSRAGNHAPAGFFIIRGPQTCMDHVPANRHICDIAPTILRLFGVKPPDYMDGEVWTEVITQGASVTGEQWPSII